MKDDRKPQALPKETHLLVVWALALAYQNKVTSQDRTAVVIRLRGQAYPMTGNWVIPAGKLSTFTSVMISTRGQQTRHERH